MKPYLTTPLLKKFKHGFFDRTGGLSDQEFKSLNCSFGNGDNKNTVVSNRALVSQQMGINSSNLIILSQIHSSNVVEIKDIIKFQRALKIISNCENSMFSKLFLNSYYIYISIE